MPEIAEMVSPNAGLLNYELRKVRALMLLAVRVQDELAFPRGPDGSKLSISYFLSGEFQGERLRGKVIPGGGDWAVYRSPDHLDIEVRAVLKTCDGAIIYLRYEGLWRATPGALSLVFARDGYSHYKEDQHYLRVFARFETADSRYEWLNGILALGVGVPTVDGVTYEFLEML